MERLNILFSASRQWNAGDEFIFDGTLKLFRNVTENFNIVLYNRNPEIRQEFTFLNPFRNMRKIRYSRWYSLLESFFRIGFYDNSFKDNMSLDLFDAFVFAGSPEWISNRLYGIYKKLVHFKNPIIYLGIGSGSNISGLVLKSVYEQVLSKSALITVRDTISYEYLKRYSPILMPCPALYCSDKEKIIEKISKIGLVFSTFNSVINNRIDRGTYEFMISLYKKLIKQYDFIVICHYIDEISEAINLFGKEHVFYSYDSKDYIDFYEKVDFVIGPRVHGIGLSASLGIPGVLIGHDLRAEAVKGFLGKIINKEMKIEDVINLIKSIEEDIKEYNLRIIEHKKTTKDTYIKLLKKVLRLG